MSEAKEVSLTLGLNWVERLAEGGRTTDWHLGSISSTLAFQWCHVFLVKWWVKKLSEESSYRLGQFIDEDNLPSRLVFSCIFLFCLFKFDFFLLPFAFPIKGIPLQRIYLYHCLSNIWMASPKSVCLTTSLNSLLFSQQA